MVKVIPFSVRFISTLGLLLSFSAFASNSKPIEIPPGIKIQDFWQVDPGLFRGGRPNVQDLKKLKKMGIQTIVSLENDEKATAKEESAAHHLGFEFHSIPMEYKTAPSDDDVKFILELITDKKNRPVFFHCRHGHDRSGLITGLYRVFYDKWTPEKGYQEMLDHGFHSKFKALVKYYQKKTGLKKIPKDQETLSALSTRSMIPE